MNNAWEAALLIIAIVGGLFSFRAGWRSKHHYEPPQTMFQTCGPAFTPDNVGEWITIGGTHWARIVCVRNASTVDLAPAIPIPKNAFLRWLGMRTRGFKRA